MKKLIFALVLALPAIATAHPGGAHSHPEELVTALMLLAVVGFGVAVYLWNRR